MINQNNYCVILAGGIGTRFWPYSRKDKPKQFLDFFGMGHTLLQQTFQRYAKIVPAENIFVITNVQYEGLVKEQLPELGANRILLEPARRNTAPCIAWAASHIRQLNPDANLIVAPSDHLILREDEFIQAMTNGLEFVARSPQLLTLGIKPTRPETGYGYIQITDEKEGDFYKVKTFIEKPQLEFAQVFVESDEFYWNSGIFLWNVNTILKAFDTFMPELRETFKGDEDDLEALPNISIDYAIMEKADEIFVFPASFGWSDLGTWGSLQANSKKDAQNNALIGQNIKMYESRNCVVHTTQEKKVVIQGLDGYIIAEKDNTLLICRLTEEQRIKDFSE